MIEIPFSVNSRWKVVFKTMAWQCGIYQPEFTSAGEIEYLEKHDHPEAFLLIKGAITLVLSENGAGLKEIPLRRNCLYIITEWHNAYRPEGEEGIALVIEPPTVRTQYLNLRLNGIPKNAP